jgi:hypothetical protein
MIAAVPVLERDVMKACLDLLKARNVFCWRQNSGAVKVDGRNGRQRFVRWATSGVSDIVGVLPGGKILCVEVKRSTGGRLTDEQSSFLDAVRRRGGVAVVITDVADLAEIIDRELKDANAPREVS